MLAKRLFSSKKNFGSLTSVVNYSRKSDWNDHDYYKVVKSNNVIDDVVDARFGSHPNWELFGPRGYRFLLPGSLGPAWHEVGSMVPLDMFHKSASKLTKDSFDILECTAQECPILLRKGVVELFPNSEASYSQKITVVTLTPKREPNFKRRTCKYSESEHYAKTFIWAAQEICMKLKDAGYWADFINPFSGKPYISPLHKSTLYETDERFRCIGFEIKKNSNCKVIQSRKDKKFIGNLFTNAPANTSFFYDLLRSTMPTKPKRRAYDQCLLPTLSNIRLRNVDIEEGCGTEAEGGTDETGVMHDRNNEKRSRETRLNTGAGGSDRHNRKD